MTLPIFGIAFGAAAAVLLVHRALRWPIVIGVGASLVAVLAWYWPHLDDLAQNSRQEYGRRIEGRMGDRGPGRPDHRACTRLDRRDARGA
jgi:hypothetical protein